VPRIRRKQRNPAESVIWRIDRLQRSHTGLAFPWAVVQKFGNDQAASKAALIAYYGLFALFPLLLLFTTLLGYFLHGNDALRQRFLNSALGSFPIIGTQLRSQTHGLEGSGSALIVGALLLLYGAMGLGLATQAGVNAVWNIPYVRRPNFVLRYVRSIAVLVLIAFSTIGSTVLTGFATLAPHGWVTTTMLLLSTIALNFLLFLAAFKVTSADPLSWRDVALGAALATVFWQAMQALGSWYISRGLSHNSDTYGFFAIVIVLLSWIYLGAQLFLLAAEVNVVRSYRLWPRSIIEPLTPADSEVFERLTEMSVRRREAQLSIVYPSDPNEWETGVRCQPAMKRSSWIAARRREKEGESAPDESSRSADNGGSSRLPPSPVD
jgi:YihY family inner membrane protein